MQPRYCRIAYPNGKPVLAEMETHGRGTKVLGHGYVDKLIEQGCTITPLVEMTPELVAAIRYARDLLAHEVAEFRDASGRESRYLAALDGLLAGVGDAT